jgi:hypothetical protein
VTGLIFGLCALLTTINAGLFLRVAHRHRCQAQYRLARRARVAASLACCVGSLIAIPSVGAILDDLTGRDLSPLISDLAAVAFCASLQVMIVDWTHVCPYITQGVRIRLVTMCLVMAALITEFQATDRDHLPISTVYAGDGDVTAYLMTYVAFAAVAGLEIAMVSTGLAVAAWRRRRNSAAGLAIAAFGGICGFAFAISRGSYLVAYWTGHAWSQSTEARISPVLAGLFIACIAIGLFVATLSHRPSSSRLASSQG